MTDIPTIEFYYNYNKSRKDLSNVFRALGDYVEAYEIIEKAIVRNLEIEGYEGLKVESLHKGSIKNIVSSFCRRFLSDSSTGLLEEFSGNEDGNSSQYYRSIEERQNQKFRNDWANDESFKQAVNDNQIRKDIAEDFFNGKLQAIQDVDIAEAGKRVSSGNNKTKRGESFSITPINSHAQIGKKVTIDMDFKVNKSVKAIFNGKSHEHNGDEIVRIIKPVQEGNDKWLVRSSTGLEFEAPILHKEFIHQYQNSFQWLVSMKVHSQYDVWRHGKEISIKNAKIHHVHEPYWAPNNQEGLLSE